MKNRKKKIAIIGTSLVAIILLTVMGIYIYTTPKVTIIKESFQFEFGEKIKLPASEVLETSNDKIYETAKFDWHMLEYKDGNNYPNVGDYKVRVSYEIRGKLYSEDIMINIVDTVAPVFTKFQDLFEIEQGSSKPNFLSFYEASDLSKVTIMADDTNVDYNTVGNNKISIKAIDYYGNEITREASVNIEAKKVSIITSDSSKYVTTNASFYYVNGILVVNKKHPLPNDYAPGENAVAGAEFRRLISDMNSLGFNISNSYSGYRSYATQASLYQHYVNLYGQTQADTFSARAGYSEHQTGLAFDLKMGSGALIQAGTQEATWVAENAHHYGFIVRYLQGKDSITGYQYEPWHLRYIGNEATAIYNSSKTLEEYLGVEGGTYL